MKKIIRKVKKKDYDKPKVKKIEPQDDDRGKALAKAIDESLKKDDKIWKCSKFFTASNTNQCLRFMGYRFFGYEHYDSISGQLQRIFDNGNDVHGRIGKYLDGIGVLIEEEREFETKPSTHEIPIHGYIDFVIDWGEEMPVEVKSINEAGFVYRKTYMKPKDDHMRQIQLYMYAGGFDRGIVLYENKNTQEIICILVERDDEFLGKIVKKYRKVYDAYKEGKISVRPYKRTSKNCQQCRAQRYCWDVDKEVGVKL